MKKYIHKQDLPKNVHNGLIHDIPHLEATQLSINMEEDKQIMVYFYNGMLLGNELLYTKQHGLI